MRQTATGRLPSNVHRENVVENADVVQRCAHVAIVRLHDAGVVDLKGRRKGHAQVAALASDRSVLVGPETLHASV